MMVHLTIFYGVLLVVGVVLNDDLSVPCHRMP